MVGGAQNAPAVETQSDVIVAVATPPGQGGVGIVRVSGPDLTSFAQAWVGRSLPPRSAVYTHMRDAAGETLDSGVALYFQAPHSYTGEDVVEWQGHGSPVLQDAIVQRAIDCGARHAQRGEFTYRGYCHGRLDLTQAEAVADIIAAPTLDAAKSAFRTLDGGLSARILTTKEALIQARALVDGTLDFPDDEPAELHAQPVMEAVARAESDLAALLEVFEAGAASQATHAVVIAGAPNVGKSSLYNALVGHDAAIVTDQPGTTRDVLQADAKIAGRLCRVIDTAGLRDESHDAIEQEGMERARSLMRDAQVCLVVVDLSDPATWEQPTTAAAVIRVGNKMDVIPRDQMTAACAAAGVDCAVSAISHDGMAALQAKIETLVKTTSPAQATMSARPRHISLCKRALSHMHEAHETVQDVSQWDIVSHELAAATGHLTEMTGDISPDDVLGTVFASFCIGK